jgi:alkylhydroperoxidase/carboxymuconolactone decarboxylase family protein YurZ
MAKISNKRRSMATISLAAAQHDLEMRMTELTELVQACLEARMALENDEDGAVVAAEQLCERGRVALGPTPSPDSPR